MKNSIASSRSRQFTILLRGFSAGGSIGFAVARSRDPLHRLLKDHVTDDARQQLAARVLERLEISGFETDETKQVMRKRPPTSSHG